MTTQKSTSLEQAVDYFKNHEHIKLLEFHGKTGTYYVLKHKVFTLTIKERADMINYANYQRDNFGRATP